MKILYTILIFTLIISLTNCEKSSFKKSENNNNPSLKIIAVNSSMLSEDLRWMVELIDKTRVSDPQKALFYCSQLIESSQKLKDKHGESLGYYKMGFIYDEHLSVYTDALVNYYKSLQKTDNPQSISYCYLRMGVVYYKLEMYDRALSYYQQFLENAEKLDNKVDQATAYRAIGMTYREGEKDYDMALSYLKKSLDIQQALRNESGLADCYHTIGATYYIMKDMVKAREYHLQALTIRKGSENEDLADTYFDLGLIYKELKEHTVSMTYFNQSLELSEKLNYDHLVKRCHMELAMGYTFQKKYQQSLYELNLAKSLADSQKDNHSLATIYGLFSETYEKNHNTNEALLALKESRKYGELYTTQQYQENKKLDNQRASVTSWEIKIKKSKEDTGTSTYQWLFFSLIGLITLVAGTVALYHTKVSGIASFAGLGNKNKKQTEKILLTELTELKEQVNQVLNNNQAQYSDQIKQEAQAIYAKMQEIETHQQHISKRGISKRKLKELWDILQNSQAFLALANQQKGNYNQTDHS